MTGMEWGGDEHNQYDLSGYLDNQQPRTSSHSSKRLSVGMQKRDSYICLSYYAVKVVGLYLDLM